jgi:limonene-1,2-epoxide hydrolase
VISPGGPSNAKEALVVQFFTDMGDTHAEMKKAFERYVHDECVWANQGFPTDNGRLRSRGRDG